MTQTSRGDLIFGMSRFCVQMLAATSLEGYTHETEQTVANRSVAYRELVYSTVAGEEGT
jgi:hypothetical protein